MRTKKPVISVLMSVYNNEGTVKDAIDSILKQTYKQFEFIIIDDGSTDGSLRIIMRAAKRDKRIRLIVNRRNLGLTKSLNKGLGLAKGAYIARMDADDLSHKDRLRQQLNYLEKHPDIALCGTWATEIDPAGKRLGTIEYPTRPEALRKALLAYNPIIHPSIMARKQAFGTGYDERYPAAQDYELILRIAAQHPIANLPKRLLSYRRDYSENISFRRLKLQQRCALRMRWKAIKRRDYPLWEGWKLLRPALTYLIPARLTIAIVKRRHRA